MPATFISVIQTLSYLCWPWYSRGLTALIVRILSNQPLALTNEDDSCDDAVLLPSLFEESTRGQQMYKIIITGQKAKVKININYRYLSIPCLAATPLYN